MELEGNQSADPIEALSEALDADIYFISGILDRGVANDLIESFADSKHKTNCALILSTYGGDADAAYIIARFLKRYYEHFTLYVFGYCKSAGTLIALGADSIVMSIHAELGPLDVQLLKEDELGRQSSGLDIFQALAIINRQAFQIFEDNFLEIKGRSGGTITTKTAADIATDIASRLLAPISAQIDPLRLGEMQRAINIAMQYGERLGTNLETLQKLVYGYPSHSFVIDYEEASCLFGNVRSPEPTEYLLEQFLQAQLLQQFGVDCVYTPHPGALVACLTKADDKESTNESIDEESDNGVKDTQISHRSVDQAAVQASKNDNQPSERSSGRFISSQQNGA